MSLLNISQQTLKLQVRGFNQWVNGILFPTSISSSISSVYKHFVKEENELFEDLVYYSHCYVRNLIAGMVIYYGVALAFSYYNYVHPRSKEIFKDREMPGKAIIWDQIKLAQQSLFIYVMLPVLADFLIEEGFTQAYYSLSDVGGLVPYLFLTVLYFMMVEIGIYWMHRTLHTNKWLFKNLHAVHHKYNKPETLTPFASIAFHPLDGILQASPYVFWLLFIPTHYFTHVGMVFGTAIWATYIHDCMDGHVEPIMSNKYHTIHHTDYHYNYGQIFIFCDKFWGTLRVPKEKTGVKRWKQKQERARKRGLKMSEIDKVDFDDSAIEKPAEYYGVVEEKKEQ